MIDVENISKSFGDTEALDGASCSVEAGQIALLTGANGAGKSTLLRVLAGLMTPDAGTARIDGVDVTGRQRQAAQGRLAYLPQDVRFQKAQTPRKMLRFYAALRQLSTGRVEPLLEEVDLAGAADRPVGALSGGMRQRLGLAVAWLPQTPVLLLDEPGLSLDRKWRAYLIEKLRGLSGEGRTVLVATHLTEVWAETADVTLRCTGGAVARSVESLSDARAVSTNHAPKPATPS